MAKTRIPDEVTRYANAIMTEIDNDIAEGVMRASVRTYGELHAYVDANDYTLGAGVPWGVGQPTDDDPVGMALTIAVQDEVTRRLSAPGRPYCTYGACTYKGHDHTTTVDSEGRDLPTPVQMRCNHCKQPAHWDEKVGDYQHDGPTVVDCFLIQRVAQ